MGKQRNSDDGSAPVANRAYDAVYLLVVESFLRLHAEFDDKSETPRRNKGSHNARIDGYMTSTFIFHVSFSATKTSTTVKS